MTTGIGSQPTDRQVVDDSDNRNDGFVDVSQPTRVIRPCGSSPRSGERTNAAADRGNARLERATRSRRSTTISLRVSPDEARAFRASSEAAGVGLSDWIRVQIAPSGTAAKLHGRPRHTPVADPRLLRQLLRISQNLNQIARALNSSPPPEHGLLIRHIAGIEAHLHRIGGVD